MPIDIEEAGNPRRKTKDNKKKKSSSRSKSGGGSQPGRKARVSVTPRDPEQLEEIANELGLPKSKVYNMGFKALLEKLGKD
ncbi:hypothetical protein GGP55_003277 [Salinibacter ruber]|uniref:hypothetical protein n=1 Tax=Salinibacter ruber TaxID=146919 RepID=UPI002169F725|nr:hypothetical protein [Salinibacter ruber]MCS3632657.1 hypothetical protein [Salinibacter ruber]